MVSGISRNFPRNFALTRAAMSVGGDFSRLHDCVRLFVRAGVLVVQWISDRGGNHAAGTWDDVLVAFLHDPPDKALDIGAMCGALVGMRPWL